MEYQYSLDFAQKMDSADPLRAFRDEFIFPAAPEGNPVVYFCGNSLGLQPKSTRTLITNELDRWANLAVEGHFKGEQPWVSYHRQLSQPAADIVGALPHEVVVMNSLTVNLHLMMVSFYRPAGERYKIMMEAGAFPSDQYAMASQAAFHGYNPDDAIVELYPRQGESCLRTEDILAEIEKAGTQLALVMLGGVNYYTGQVYDMAAITQAAHRTGAKAGFDLAHAAGNIPLALHDWNVDFAVWCTYKYLNSGPGGTSGVFVHERFADTPSLPRFAGWWGHNLDRRFLMEKEFQPMYGADGWQLSCSQVLPLAAHKAALDITHRAGMEALRHKSLLLTGYLEYLLDDFNQRQRQYKIQIITPRNPAERGCQLSTVWSPEGRKVFERLSQNHVIADWREPDVIRLAPVPLYNSFEDVYRFARILHSL